MRAGGASLGLRARAAAATLELFGFNPHQRRGPDGRFIKMPDSELKRPRRPARARRKTAGRPPLDAPYAQRRDALAASVLSGMAGEGETLAQGVMGETRRHELKDGTSAIYKRALRDRGSDWDRAPWSRKDQADAEELSSVVADALGVRAPAVHRVSDDELYMDVMPGKPAITRVGEGMSFGKMRRSEQGRRVGLLDLLIDNTDRHAGNWLVDDDGNISAIDHGLAFSHTYRLDPSTKETLRTPASEPRVSSPFVDDYVLMQRYVPDNPLAPSDVPKIRERLERTRPEFERVGHLDWYDAMLQRLDLLAANAGGSSPLY